jgi:hypothetical protein
MSLEIKENFLHLGNILINASKAINTKPISSEGVIGVKK